MDPSARPGEGVRMRRRFGSSTGDARLFKLAFCNKYQEYLRQVRCMQQRNICLLLSITVAL